ncbi:protein ERGIC-53-like [Antedon mediterranea]|uniref:protein ERGIC-53-like n=1 Tax=Antedon mediterranea TaxID=105859 RepID=UPI003AF840CC
MPSYRLLPGLGIVALLTVIYTCFAQAPHKTFQFKYSLKGPHLSQEDGTVPFWEYGGSALASEDQVRITPSLRSKRGYIWNKYKTPYDHWEVEVVFRVTGRGRIGADGLAIWYTTEKSNEGPVYGNIDKWNGLGVFFDSFDNDNQRNNPYILAVVNDGTKNYDHNTDGLTQQIGGCLRDFRNRPYAVRVKIEYYKKSLTVSFHSGMSNSDADYEPCFTAGNIELPKNGYFGVTAATGGLADDHDLLKFLTHSLVPPDGEEQTGDGHITEEERQKFKEEYEQYYKKLEKQREEYKQKNPDKAQEMDEVYEDQTSRELRQVYESQSNIIRVLGSLQMKLDEISGRQERTISTITNMGSIQQGQPVGQPQDGIKRHEIDNLLKVHSDLQRSVTEIRASVGDIQQKANFIHAKSQQQGAGGGIEGGLISHEIQDNLRNIKADLSSLVKRPEPRQIACPPIPEFPTCLTPMYFVILICLQCAMFIGFIIYKNKQEAAAKKFY